MSENTCNVINDVVILPEIEQTWEIICQHLINDEWQTIQEIFQNGRIPPKEATVLSDGGLQIYAPGEGGKIVLLIPPEAWSYKSLH